MALVPDQKFSTFQNGGTLEVDDIVVGLRNGINTKFTYTGELPPGVVVPIDQGGTGATTAAGARFNLGLGTMAVQNANAVAISGGSAALDTGSVVAAPVAGIDIANKTYVDAQIAGSVTSAQGTANQILINGLTTPQTGALVFTLPQDIATTSSPVFAGFKDINGNNVLTFASGASNVNYFMMQTQPTGQGPILTSAGADSTVPMTFFAKGGGNFNFQTTAFQPISIECGTGLQHTTIFQFADTAASRTATFQDSDGTVAWLSDVLGTVTSAQGTQNQVLVNGTFGTQETGDIILTLPQDIATTSSPTFSALTLTNPLTVANGGSGLATLTAYTLLAGGTTATGNLQQVSAGTAGQLLQSNGGSALPSWTTATFPSGSGTLNHMLRSDGTNWVQTTATTLDASDVFSGISQLNVDNLRLDGNTFSSTDVSGNIYLQPNGVGRTVITNTATPSGAFLGQLAVVAVSTSGSETITSYTANTGQSSQLFLAKSHSTVPGVFSALGSSELIGRLFVYGDDGTQFTESSEIRFSVNGTVSNAVVPGTIQFLTANAAGAITQALALDSSQQAIFTNNIVQNGRLVGTTQIQNSVGQPLLSFLTGGGTPFNYMQISNAATGANAAITALGGNANVAINMVAKGSGQFGWYTTGTTPWIMLNGTGYQRTNQFVFADTAGNFAYTFPPSTGTIALTATTTSSIQGTANQVLVNGTSGSPVTGAAILTTPQDIAVTSSPTFVNLTLGGTISGATALRSAAGLNIATLTAGASAVNYLTLTSVATGNAAVLGTSGSDTNVDLRYFPKAAGVHNFLSTNSSPFIFQTGTGYQRTSTLVFGNTSASYSYTFPDASGTILISGVAINSVPSITFSSTSGIIGTTTNDSAASGSVGQVISSVITSGSPVSLTSGMGADITSISLAAGDYIIWGNVSFLGNVSTLGAYLIGWMNTTSVTPTDSSLYGGVDLGSPGLAISANSTIYGVNVPQRRLSLAAPATLYLSCQAGFTVSTLGAFGGIYALRIR